MSLLQRLDSFLRDENRASGKDVTKAPLGPEASSFLNRADGLSFLHAWMGDLIGEYRLSQRFAVTIDDVYNLLVRERDFLAASGGYPENSATSGIDINYIKLDHDTDVGVYISFHGNDSEWFSYYLRLQCGGRADSRVDSARRITIWRVGESRQLRRERYDNRASSGAVSSRELRKDRMNPFDLKAFKDAEVSSLVGTFTRGSSRKKAEAERQWYNTARKMISSALSKHPCFGIESQVDSEVGYY